MVKKLKKEMEKIQTNIDKEFFYDKNEVYEALTKVSKELIVIGNLKSSIYKYPREIADFLGISSQIVEKPLKYWKKIVLKEDWDKFYESKQKSLSGEEAFTQIDFRIKDKDNKIIWLNCVGNTIKDENGIPSTFVGTISIHKNNNKIDAITKLLVVSEFFKALKSKIEKYPKKLDVIILGLNNFKRINEFYGRETGDMILEKMSQIIKENIPKNGEVYRLDGTNFGIIVENMTDIEIAKIYKSVKIQFTKKQIISKYEDILTISAGVATYPDDGGTYQEIYQHSKYARGYSKYNENSLIFFNQELFDSRERYLKILSYLKRDIDEGFKNFDIAFQPQIVASDQKIKGVEALLRWKCEEYGNIPPLEFIPILEENNLMVIVGKWVLKRTLEIYKKEWEKYRKDFLVSVNVSFVQFVDKEFVKDIERILKESKVNPANLILELTENYLIKNTDYIQKTYKALKVLGIKIALDDFGSGYSSLGVLKELPIDIIKIDRIFIKNLLHSDFNAEVIRFMTKICHTIDMEVCVEGVENKEEYDLVKTFGVDYIQGYYFGKPVSKEEITERIKK